MRKRITPNAQRRIGQRLVNNDGQGKHAAQRRGYSFLSFCLPDSFVLASPLRRDTATSTRDACATQIRVHSCLPRRNFVKQGQFEVRLR